MIVRADAFSLPFLDDSFDVIIADPPYAGKNRGKKGVGYKAAGYIPYRGREWWAEAWRVLKSSGHLYVFSAVRELPEWLTGARAPVVDIIAWVAPNNPSLSAYWRRGIGGRAPAWRPIIHWQKDPKQLIRWPDRGTVIHATTGTPLRGSGPFVDPNFFMTAAIQSNMREAEAWPNQLPVQLLRWLLRPHHGLVLDLFSGTGTTRVAATGLGLNAVSVERSKQALGIISRRPAQMALVAT